MTRAGNTAAAAVSMHAYAYGLAHATISVVYLPIATVTCQKHYPILFERNAIGQYFWNGTAVDILVKPGQFIASKAGYPVRPAELQSCVVCSI